MHTSAAPDPQAKGARFYRPELDILRFTAFLMVFVGHVASFDSATWARRGLPNVLAVVMAGVGDAGSYGVDLFFAISSFLLTSLLLREAGATGQIHIWRFYVRRTLRIWPLYFSFLLIVVPALRYILPNESFPTAYLVSFALFAGNWICAFRGYPASAATPLWSVSIEEQFYAVWPWLMRGSRRQLLFSVILMLVVASATRIYLVYVGSVHPAIWCNTLARLDPIALGALLAMSGAVSVRPRWLFFGLGSLLFILCGCFGSRQGVGSLLTYPAIAIASVMLIAASRSDTKPSALARPIIYLGRISYGLYVFHAACIALLRYRGEPSVTAYAASVLEAFLLTVVIAAVSYEFLEKPFLLLKERFTVIPSRPA